MTEEIFDYYRFSTEICQRLGFPRDAEETFLAVEQKIKDYFKD